MQTLQFRSLQKREVFVRKGDCLELYLLLDGVVGETNSGLRVLPFEFDPNAPAEAGAALVHKSAFKILCFN